MESDTAILKDIGERLSRVRLDRDRTQAELARAAGVSRRTVSKAENGHVIDSQSLVRILRALDLLAGLDTLIPAPRVSPVALARDRGRVRERASGGRTRRRDNPAGEWTWPDEEP
jgi:transcriptional regulator with XRE-family HTH domain